MSSTWKWKSLLSVLALLMGIYFIIPTVCHFQDGWRTAEAANPNDPQVPWYYHAFPKNYINLGLDLRGGIYVEMQVDVPDAIKRQADYMITQLTRNFKEKQVMPVSIDQPEGNGVIVAAFNTPGDVAAAKDILADQYNGALHVLEETTVNDHPALKITFNDKYRNFLVGELVKQARETVANRIDRYGVGEPEIRIQGDDRIAIELPGMSDPDRAINLIKQTGLLEFKLVNTAKTPQEVKLLVDEARKTANLPEGYSAEDVAKLNAALKDKIPNDSEIAYQLVRDPIIKKITSGIPYLIFKKVELSGQSLQNARKDIDQQNHDVEVLITFDKGGAQTFGEITKANVGKQLAIMLDGYINSAPRINEPILGGSARITFGSQDFESANREGDDLSLVLREGALPVKLTEATKTVVGPTLGADSIRQGVHASLVAALVVVLFMLIYYRLSGLVANIALAMNVVLILACLALFGATLTLPGIAGIVLTMGMAVDANVIINERIREEIRKGAKPAAAIGSGYGNAMRAVIDSNITTLIAGLVLYQFGTGPIRGFAVTLSIGILTTLFTAVVVTRLIYDYFLVKRKIEKVSI
ncbi:MAG: protein translocase subunit SecD [Deltaproteobacteria bacterium CG11_big_fil_rev_8_21_14_0_20_47_16]|nr:MAG: protein translocase subunit SecD [Deltaproteobacteria bacterium CG11_big_fil_rev_8_21_14_0_20_47_16]